jgi:D-alanyl-lipoteichoic acid acyltransferase DltB (MBOAT superfamily)
MYYPQLVAGPIERPQNLLHQFKSEKTFKFQNFYRGLRLIVLGFFMKLVVADRLAIYVDSVYNNADHHSGATLGIATVFFSFQIYCDFAGYSSIAIGASRIMGINLMTNFRRPYLASSIGNFWRRWHISLSTWFKDYVYIPLGGRNVTSKIRLYFNLLITFLLSGFWHGANWTFIIWGGLNGFYLILESLIRHTAPVNKMHFPRFVSVLYVFILISFSWIFFRSNSLQDAMLIIDRILIFNGPIFIPSDAEILLYCILGILIVTISEIAYENIYKNRAFSFSRNRVSNYYLLFLVLCIMLFGVFDGGQFIYFQF